MMKWLVSKGFCTFVLLVLQSGLPAHAFQPVAGIEWHAGLKLGDVRASSLAEWRAALSQRWRLGNGLISFSVGDGSRRILVNRCDQLFAAVASAMHASGPDQAIFESWTVKCEAVRVLVEGVAPQTDFIGDLPLGEKEVRTLPIGMAFVLSLTTSESPPRSAPAEARREIFSAI